MQARKGNGGGDRRTKSVSNQGAFNVICLAVAIFGTGGTAPPSAHTEPCTSEYNG
jgi:hypothetical protein